LSYLPAIRLAGFFCPPAGYTIQLSNSVAAITVDAPPIRVAICANGLLDGEDTRGVGAADGAHHVTLGNNHQIAGDQVDVMSTIGSTNTTRILTVE
jgi:hypothetical protein